MTTTRVLIVRAVDTKEKAAKLAIAHALAGKRFVKVRQRWGLWFVILAR